MLNVFLTEPLRRAQREMDAEKFDAFALELRKRVKELRDELKENRRLLARAKMLAEQCQREAYLCRIARKAHHRHLREPHLQN